MLEQLGSCSYLDIPVNPVARYLLIYFLRPSYIYVYVRSEMGFWCR